MRRRASVGTCRSPITRTSRCRCAPPASRGVDFVPCVYFQPDEPAQPAPPVSDNCRKVNPMGSLRDAGLAQGARFGGAGTLIDGSRGSAGGALSGTPGADLIIDREASGHRTLVGGRGFDVLRGSGAVEVLDGWLRRRCDRGGRRG